MRDCSSRTYCAVLALAVLALAAMLAAGARAASVVETEFTKTEIISERAGFSPGETTWFAIRQEVIEGWHVFWKNPGDAGLPMALRWDLPPGYAVGEIRHPVPQYIPVGPLASFAHEGEPVFLLPVTAPADAPIGEELTIAIDALWQVCEEICVPEERAFSFTLPIMENAPLRAERRDVFAGARAKLPKPLQGAAHISRTGDAYELTIADWRASAPAQAFFFPAIEGFVKPAGAQTLRMKETALTIAMIPGWASETPSDRVEGVLKIEYADGEADGYALAAEIAGDLAAPPRAAASGNPALILLLAFLGGLILNVMPCVFPIIFIKAAALIASARQNAAVMRRDGLFYTAGVLAAFAAMGGLLLVLRAGGEQLGWGFHLQSPITVGISAYVLLLVGLNLTGVFTIGAVAAGTGQTLTEKSGAAGAFFTGALAVVVAAPCIGPLLSAPMGAALAQPPLIGMLIFIMMGLGLAAPYLVLSFVPGLGRYLPKPGAWMRIFKQALAFPVFAAAAYFLWVFALQTGQSGLAAILAGAVFLGLAAWLFELSKGDDARALVLRAASALVGLAALAPILRAEPVAAAPASSAAYGTIATEPYSEDRLAQYRASSTPVFVDFTAAWCVTCQFNKMTVLKQKEVADAFAQTGTVLMVADWTVRDPVITAALESFGASGVPLYVYYPSGGQPQILPQTLTRGVVVGALESGALIVD